MCLSLAIDRPNDILLIDGKHVGHHAGHEFMILRNGMGFRCGYVKVGPDHPWHGKEMGEVDDSVALSRSITFAEYDSPCREGKLSGHSEADNGYWVGFAGDRYNDAPDPELMDELIRTRMSNLMPMYFDSHGHPHGHVWSQAEVETECRKLCEQAAEAAKEAEQCKLASTMSVLAS